MIEELAITDLGVISRARIEPAAGLTAITGETGAGKTMVLSGLALILGRKADSGSVRPGADRATAEARLVPPPGHPALQRALDAGALVEEGVLLASRSVAATGRSRAYLGGRSVPAGVLGEIGDSLVTVHGQSDQQRLRATAQHRAALDAFAGNQDLARAHARAHRRRLQAVAALERFDADHGQRAAELQHLERALAQIRELALEPGEEEALRAEAERLGNVEDLRQAAGTVSAAVSGDPSDPEAVSVLTLLEHARRQVGIAQTFDATIAHWAEQIDQVSYVLADLGTEAAGYVTGLEADPHRLDHVHQRRATITDLARSYLPAHPDSEQDLADQLLAFADEAERRIGELRAPGGGREALSAELQEADASATSLAGELTNGRRAGAEAMSEAVVAELRALAMPGATFQVRLVPRTEPGEHGMEDVEFLLAAHAGAPPRPLGKGASGGELSRVMLAIEVALARSRAQDQMPLPAFVFDEVDAGVGGRAALEVGQRLAELARHTQVIVITHLAQVASFAEKHVVVTKRTDQSVTDSDVTHVTGREREAELARMLSGEEDSDAARQHAADLLARSSVQR